MVKRGTKLAISEQDEIRHPITGKRIPKTYNWICEDCGKTYFARAEAQTCETNHRHDRGEYTEDERAVDLKKYQDNLRFFFYGTVNKIQGWDGHPYVRCLAKTETYLRELAAKHHFDIDKDINEKIEQAKKFVADHPEDSFNKLKAELKKKDAPQEKPEKKEESYWTMDQIRAEYGDDCIGDDDDPEDLEDDKNPKEAPN